MLHVARDDSRMARLAEALAFFAPEAEVLRFPAWDCLPYDRVSPNPDLVAERIATLARLLEKPDRPAHRADHGQRAGAARAAARDCSTAPAWSSRPAARVDPEELARFLEANGYGRAGTVMEPGEYAMRGGIIDIFPAGEADPVRLDLFGDTIESIRRFDPATQRSGDAAEGAGPAPGLRGAARQATVDRPLPHRLARAVRRGRRRGPDLPVDLRRPPPSRHGALGAAVPRADGDPARLSARRLGQPGPPGRGRADRRGWR